MGPVRSNLKGPLAGGIPGQHLPSNVIERSGTIEYEDNNLRLRYEMRSDITRATKWYHATDYKLIKILNDLPGQHNTKKSIRIIGRYCNKGK